MQDNNTPILDQTIPLRVSAETKAALVAMAKAESRSLNNWLNLRFADIIANATLPTATHNPSGLLGDSESVRIACNNTLDLGEVEQPTPHKAIVKSKAKPKAKAKAKTRR